MTAYWVCFVINTVFVVVAYGFAVHALNRHRHGWAYGFLAYGFGWSFFAMWCLWHALQGAPQ